MAAKRLADSEQSSSKQSRIEDTQSRGRSDAGGSSDEWPTVFAGSEVVWHDSAHNWETDVKEVILNGEQHYPFFMRRNGNVGVALATQTQFVEVDKFLLSTTTSNQATFALRAHLLVSECCLLQSVGQCHSITQFVRGPTQPNPDSDDEQATDPIIPPRFASDELVVINFQYSSHLWDSYQAARVKGFQNAMGKLFFMELGNFLIHIHPLCLHQCYKSTCSTNPRGDAQPGNLLVILTDDCRELKTVANTKIRKQQRRIADYVMYDGRNEMYSIVGEISKGEDANVEQMVGLFRQHQQAMLGFTCNNEAITLRILIQNQNTLTLTVLPPLSLAEEEYSQSMRKLAELFLAFISIVNIAL